MNNARQAVADLDGIRIAYDDHGSADHAATLFLHGFPLSASMWSGQLALADRHRLIIPDLRGHGQSAVTEGTVTMATMADDMAKLLDTLNIETVTVCGLSMGGYVAWEFWRRHRDRLAALILFDTRAVADTEEVRRGRQMMAAQVVSSGAEMAATSMLPKLMAKSTYEHRSSTVDAVRQMILATDPHGIAATQRGMSKRVDMTDSLSEIEVPTLVICGEEDSISPPDEMEGFANKMPNARFCRIEDAGHLAPLEQPASTNVFISDFLTNI